jgi:hypothetical protein
MTVVGRVFSPAEFAAELEAIDPRDPIAAAWRWRLAGGGSSAEDYEPRIWREASLAFDVWHSRVAGKTPDVQAHLEELRRGRPEPRAPAAIDSASATVELQAGIVAMLEKLVDTADITPGRRGSWQQDVRRLRELVDAIRTA